MYGRKACHDGEVGRAQGWPSLRSDVPVLYCARRVTSMRLAAFNYVTHMAAFTNSATTISCYLCCTTHRCFLCTLAFAFFSLVFFDVFVIRVLIPPFRLPPFPSLVQELWKDREERSGLGGGPFARGRGPRASRGGRMGGRGGIRVAQGSGGRPGAASRVAKGRGDGGSANRAEGGGSAVGRGGGGGGQSRGPPFNSTSRQAGGSPSQGSSGGGEGGGAVGKGGLEAGGGAWAGDASGGIGQGGRSHKQNVRGGRGIGGVAGRGGGGRSAVGGMHGPHSAQQPVVGLNQQQHQAAAAAYPGYNRGPPQQQQHPRNVPPQARNGSGRSPSFSRHGHAAVTRTNRPQQRWDGRGDKLRAPANGVGTTGLPFGIAGPEQHDPWTSAAIVRALSLSPRQSAVVSPTFPGGDGRALMRSPLRVAGSASSTATPPPLHSLSLLPVFPPDSPENFGDLASIALHNSTPSPPHVPPSAGVHDHNSMMQSTVRYGAITPSRQETFGLGGSAFLSSHNGARNNIRNHMNSDNIIRSVATTPDGVRRGGEATSQLEGRGIFSRDFSRSAEFTRTTEFSRSMELYHSTEFSRSANFSALKDFPTTDSATMDNKSSSLGTPSSAYSTPRRSPKPPTDLSLLTDPALDVDIQDICVDADLNADAPAFVPGGYLLG